MVSVLAIVCARNEQLHIHRCVGDLIAGGCEVVVIDNDSTDGTRAIAETFRGRGLIETRKLPWEGSFSLTSQLRAKRHVIEGAAHDWILHADADEWLVSPKPDEALVQAISRADAQGFNVVNFHECVFIPRPGEDYCGPGYAERMRDYYFFQPHYPRLNRAWRRDAALDNSASGGHVLTGAAINLSPQDLILRHYIVLSEAHARAKYVSRTFHAEDLARQWHGNRVNINADNIRLRTHPAMRQLHSTSDHSQFDLTQPVQKHYWEWPDA
jgi:glycosyltransferase involved in cell wall biosynthesis